MPRIKQKRVLRGSQRWLQSLVNEYPEIISNELTDKLNLTNNERIIWLSPLQDDDFAKYSDEAFIERLGVKLGQEPLSDFWPRGWPVWDG